MSARSSARLEPAEVQQILSGIGAKTTPAEHISLADALEGGGGRSHLLDHASDMSRVSAADLTSAARSHRFSITFPVQPTRSPVRTPSPTRNATVTSTEGALPAVGPTDTNFLTAIAAHERRVLELKEELGRAEAELSSLKEQWAQHEAQKKRNEARRVTKLRPVPASPQQPRASDDDSNGSNAWMQAEMERRKALLGQTRTGSRTVFAGSKHTRALSLLSPVQSARTAAAAVEPARPATSDVAESRSRRMDSLEETGPRTQDRQPRPAPALRSSIDPAVPTEAIASELGDKALDSDILLKTGKKMATDLRDGLWTFWEDLREATVGGEGPAETSRVLPLNRTKSPASNQALRQKDNRKSPSRPTKRGSAPDATSAGQTKRQNSPGAAKASLMPIMKGGPALADPNFWKDHGVVPLPPSPTMVKKPTRRELVRAAPEPAAVPASPSDAAWDTWDDASIKAGSPRGPASDTAGSETNTAPTTASEGASPRLSSDAPPSKSAFEALSSKGPIPWPVLSTLGSQALRRTAGHLMSEWEQSLASESAQEFSGGGEFLGSAAETSAADSLATKDA